ncbi:period circadian protein homolog 1a [Chanos chanos]|uniref:Period circadian protein homolog 1a n=1 Tax=Chanos chanos TaxID=29144 RepID=A0A6J2WW23_CHACN|nr:period circadian protein homolog 1-like [Chanos chanos]
MSDVNVETPASNVSGRGARAAKEDRERARANQPTGLNASSISVGSQNASAAGGGPRAPRGSNSDDTDAQSSGNDSGERECEGHMGQETSTCSFHNGKDSAMETTESKSSNSQSPSPPGCSVAYSLLSGSSEQDHPSTSGCSSDQPARLQTQKELLKALRELKIRVPADHRGKGRSSTLASLQYALSCVKQVRANQEYYHQWSVEESHGCCLDLSTFTIEELDNITSEYTLQNTDTFSVAVSFLTGKVVYISPQASSLLRCKPERLQGALFSELLAPQDVSTFYSSTAPCRLPHWGSCTSSASPVDCAQEKSMFCRISGGKGNEGEVKYYPFRLTPYQLTIRDSDSSQPQPCCLLITERVHSGYEAPRIPADKRIFTTSHTPSCLFQEIDERAVPLLGYLPQDLVGTPLLLYLHPEDRPLMVAIHKKILQFAGQPFDHSPLRMCARSGEYLTIDTSWSSFINPWSRKVAFIVGRHKVRTSPLNEDVFTFPAGGEARTMSPDIVQLSEQIHRLLVQPVHSSGSQGYCSLESSGSYELQPSTGSSSDSNSHAVEEIVQPRIMTFQQICKDVHMVKTCGQQVFMESRNRAPPGKCASSGLAIMKPSVTEPVAREGLQGEPAPLKTQTRTQSPREGPPTTYSYQQINCLDSIIRYLESCNIPNTVKRKCGSSSGTTSSTSDDDKQREAMGTTKDMRETLGVNDGAKVGSQDPTHPLTPLALHYKAESVVSVTSQCSFSSTIVHVGDKKPPESDIVMMEEPPTTPTPAPSTPAPPTSTTTSPPQPVTSATPEKEDRREDVEVTPVGLTKEVLSAHTQQEEQAFLTRFRDLSHLRVLQPSSAPQRGHTVLPTVKSSRGVHSSQDYPARGGGGRKRGRGGKRIKYQQEGSQQGSYPLAQSFSGSVPNMSPNAAAERPSASAFPSAQHVALGMQTSSVSWPPSVGSQASVPPAMPSYPLGCLPFYSPYAPFSQQLPPPQLPADPALQMGLGGPQAGPRFPMQGSQIMPPMAPPVMAFIMPNYMFPQLGAPVPQLNPTNIQLNAPVPQLNQTGVQFNPADVGQANPGLTSFNPALGRLHPSTTHLNPSPVPLMSQQFCAPNPMFPFPNPAVMSAGPILPPGVVQSAPRGPSRSSTPQSSGQPPGEREGVESPLFQSRCSSPLNLLQLEELPSNRPEGTCGGAQQTPPPVGGTAQERVGKQGGGIAGQTSVKHSNSKDAKVNDNTEANESNQDAMSTSSDLLDLLLQEDSRSGTGSAASGSGSSGSGSGSSGSGSNGCSTSGSETRSSNTSKYFGSVDSSENDHSHKQAQGDSGEEQFIKYVLQDPIWLLMANTDDKVMMTYQLPSRDRETVLREDRAVLKAMQKQQPRFSEEQKKELSQVHPWIQTGRLPKAINIQSCTGCEASEAAPLAVPLDLEPHDMDLSSLLPLQDGADSQDHLVSTGTADGPLPSSPTPSETERAAGRAQRGVPDTSAHDTAEDLKVTSSLEAKPD